MPRRKLSNYWSFWYHYVTSKALSNGQRSRQARLNISRKTRYDFDQIWWRWHILPCRFALWLWNLWKQFKQKNQSKIKKLANFVVLSFFFDRHNSRHFGQLLHNQIYIKNIYTILNKHCHNLFDNSFSNM